MVLIKCDGLCEPRNPGGTACYGWVAYDGESGEVLAKDADCVGSGEGMTNNVAEYHAIIRALVWCYKSGHREGVVVESDSQLVINQINGDYSCNSANLVPLFQRVKRAKEYVNATFEWIPRERNEEADELSRYAYMHVTGRGLPTQVSKCRSCGADIYWLDNPATSKKNPVDVEPVEGGNLSINRELGQYHVVPPEQRKSRLYQSHFVSCPNASQHRASKEVGVGSQN